MSLMNYLGAVASAAMEAAATSAIQQGSSGVVTASATPCSTGRGDTPVVSTNPIVGGSVDPNRASVSVPQGLPGFSTVVPITIHHSSGPSGQFAYAVQARLAHPHAMTGGTQRTFTLPAGMTLAPGQVPAHFSLSTGNSSQPTVEIRLPHPPSMSSPVPASVGSHLVDKQQRPGMFQVNPAAFRGPSIPLTTLTHQVRPMEHELRREITASDLRLKSPPAIANLNTTRPSVLMGPRNNIPHEYIPRADPAVALQDHNYTLPRMTPVHPLTPTFTQITHHHQPKEPVVPPPPLPPTVPTLPLTQLRAPSPPNNKIHMSLSHPPPPPISMHPKPPPPSLFTNVRGMSPPVSADALSKTGRPRSVSPPVMVPGRRRRRKTLEKNKDDRDIVPLRKPGVPGKKRAKKHGELLTEATLNNSMPPYAPNSIHEQDQVQTSPKFQDDSSSNSSVASSEPIKRKLKKTRLEIPQMPQQYGRKGREKDIGTTEEEDAINTRFEKSIVSPIQVQVQDQRTNWEGKPSIPSESTSPPVDSQWGAHVVPPPAWARQSPPPPLSPPPAPQPVNNVGLNETDTPSPTIPNSNNTQSNISPEDWNGEGITRCICDYLHDDGFMICCDKCQGWQHVDCMGIDRHDIPEAYQCELCNPRWVSKARARAIQTRKKEMMDLGVVEEESAVRNAGHDGEKNRLASPIESSLGAPPDVLSSPGKSSGKLKRRGRPSLSNGQPFSDSDSEVLSSTLHSPTAKRSRKFSGKRGQNLSVALDFDSPSKIGSRKRRSSERGPRYHHLDRRAVIEPPKTRRSYARRNTITSPLSSPGREDSVKSIEDLMENSMSDGAPLDENGKEADDRGNVEVRQEESKSDSNGLLVIGESRRKRKQIFKEIPNGDLSPPHIIPSTSPSHILERQAAKSRSPSFDKTPPSVPVNSLSNTVPPTASSPDPTFGASGPSGSLHINISLGLSAYSCPYSSSPYLDKYEEAENAVCSYSPELRAKLLKNHGGMLGSSFVPDFTPLPDDGTKRWKLGVTSLEGGKKLKTLLAAVRVEPGQAIIEFIGKFLMHTGFIPTNKKANSSSPGMISPEPFVFFHQVPKNGMCICIDSRKYGNDARFVRRSCVPNAEIRHVVGKGTIHAYVVATSVIDLDDELTIPHEYKSVTCNTMNSVVQKYHVLPPPLPCACSDLDTCKAVINDSTAPVNDVVVHKKNGALVSPPTAPQEIRERKRRMSSRRTSLIVEKEPVETIRKELPPPSPPPQPQPTIQEPSTVAAPISSPVVDEPQESSSTPAPTPVSKERSDGRTTRARTVANATVVQEEPTPPTPVTSKRKSDATPTPSSSSSSSTSRQRNRSGADNSIATTPVSVAIEQHSSTESHKLTREERKLQSVLKIIEKMESNQKKKESRQNQKKEKPGKEKKSEDREIDREEESQLNSSSALAPIRFAPTSNKKKGRKRGRSTSKSGNKPQMISQRNSGSIADLRSMSTESDFNSADEAARAGMSPLQENMGPNFRLPKKKEMMSEWRIGSHASPALPSQYMRKTNINSITTTGTATPPVQPSTSSSGNFLVLPVANGNLDNASAKKRWLRQAISEETDPATLTSPNSRPNSPIGVECLAPLKKRRLARASMSSEVSNTPPSTPNNTETGCSEMDPEAADETEHNDPEPVHRPEEEEVTPVEPRDVPSRKWSCSEVSSAEEDMDDMDDTHDKTNNENTSESTQQNKTMVEDMDSFSEGKSDSFKQACNESLSPNRSTTPRRSRWDQVDAPEPVVNSSNSNSPVKSTSDAIVLDYVRNPEQYAKLTGVNSFEPEKGASGEKEATVVVRQHDTGEHFDHHHSGGSTSQRDDDADRRNVHESGEVNEQIRVSEIVKSSPKTPTQVKKKLSMEEYFKRKKEGHSMDERVGTALINSTGTALNSMNNSDSNSCDNLVIPSKEMPSPKTDGEPKVRGTLQFSSTPTLAERKREELGKRLSKSFGIRVPDAEAAQSEKQPTPTHSSPREPLEKQHKMNGEIAVPYVRSGAVSASCIPPPPPPGGPPPHALVVMNNSPQVMGHRLSVPTPAALKQSGMPPLPPQHASHVHTTPNGASSKSGGITPNGYMSSSQQSSSYRHFRGVQNGPSSYPNHQHASSRSQSNSSSSQSQGPIIGGVPVGNLIPPPPPPTASQGSGGPAFAKRFYNKRFFPS